MFSDDGADDCTVCEAGYYCGSNQTTALAMYTGGGSWDFASDDAGMCFNGTYCAAGMNRAPGAWTRLRGWRLSELRMTPSAEVMELNFLAPLY